MAILSKTAASLRILGDTLNPDEITILLGKRPDSAERKGEAVATPLGNTRIARTGAWCVTTRRRRPGDLDRQIAALLDGTTDDLHVWQDIARQFQVEIFCGLFLESFNEGLPLAATTLLLLGERNIALDLDIYARGDD